MNHAVYLTASVMLGTVCGLQSACTFADGIDRSTAAPATSSSAEYLLAQTSNANARRRERELRRRQFDQQFERQRKEFERRRKQAKLSIEQQRKKLERTRQEFKNRNSKSSAPPFDPTKAPDPKACFEHFIRKVKKAKSLDDIIKYLPLNEQRSLKAEQARYDPSEVPAERAQWKKLHPDITEETLQFFTQAPYDGAFEHYKSIANKFRFIKSVKIDGSKARISIATFHTVIFDGVPYDFSSATVDLVGEVNYWRVSCYNDSGIYYRY